MQRTCTGCNRELGSAEFSTDSVANCKACIAWVRLKREAEISGHELQVPKAAFYKWFGKSASRACGYCGISEPAFIDLKRASVRGTPIKSLEVHEIEADQGFTPKNLHMCCVNCHRIRSNLFTHEEMRHVGKAINAVWKSRTGRRPSHPQPVTPAVRYNASASRKHAQAAS